ncbi:GRAA protein, partial [Atlantisia rogersi]|nr:GRAA protein [Atlantisia rogersi]
MTSHLIALLLSLIAVILPLRYGCTDIIGGRVVRPHSWPYIASIQKENSIWCGGALVEEQWVLTAAHCKAEGLRVVLGAHRASRAEKSQQIFKVTKCIPYPEFDPSSKDPSSKENDIMLLKLNDTAEVNKYVKCLPLPDSGEDLKPGTKCKVAGWGLKSSTKPSECLREATLKIVDRKTCQTKYGSYAKITNNMLCALGKTMLSKSDACKGDSGGPLICGKRYSGIVSFGKRCGTRPMVPGVYTRLTKNYIDWIKEVISCHSDK